MKIQCNSSELAKACLNVQRTVSNKSTIPSLEGILIDAKDNNVTLTGNVSALNGNAYDVTISGTLPYTRTVTAGYYGTICLPFGSKEMTGATFFETSHVEDNIVYFNEVTTLEAGHAYIFLASANEITVISDGTTADAPVNVNGLYGTFEGITDVANVSSDDEYIIVYNPATDRCELSKCLTGCTLDANRAYVVLDEVGKTPVQPMPGCRRVGMGVQGGNNAATGLDNITNGENTTIKLIENGQFIIIRNGEKFNAQGQKL